MAEPSNRRPVRSKKPIVYFDDKIVQSLVPKKPKAPTKPTEPTKPAKAPPKSLSLPNPGSSADSIILDEVLDDAVDELCSQTEGLDIEDDPKMKKKAKAAEIARLTALGLQGVMEEAKPLKEVEFEAFDPREP